MSKYEITRRLAAWKATQAMSYLVVGKQCSNFVVLTINVALLKFLDCVLNSQISKRYGELDGRGNFQKTSQKTNVVGVSTR